MDQQFTNSDSVSFNVASADQETIPEIEVLREELRACDDTIVGLQANVEDVKQESRMLKDQLMKLVDRLQHLAVDEKQALQVDERAALSAEISEALALLQILGHNKTPRRVKLPFDNLKDILSYLNRFELDRCELSCQRLRAAVAALPSGENLRDVGSLRIEVITREEWGPRPNGSGLHPPGLGAYYQQYIKIPKRTYTITANAFSDPMVSKNGATSVIGKLEWGGFDDVQMATSQFVRLLRNTSVRQLSSNIPLSHQVIQVLSDPNVDVTSMAVDSFALEAANLAVARDALMSLRSLKDLIIDDVPLDLLSDDFLHAATETGLMRISLKSRCFHVGAAGAWVWNVPLRRRIELYCEGNYPELSGGLTSFLFRENLDDNAKIQMRFPAAHVSQDICLKFMESATSSKAHYSIDASFVAVNNITQELAGFEEYRTDSGDNEYVRYKVHGPHSIVELNITTMDLCKGWDGAPTLTKLVEFRRYRKSNETAEN
ncbi:hypothetical protein AAVH_20048 [Aphelenchoides avenae]|nr:hypothetical protein AAVH_20048 [Aphelenchus avenae]